MTQIEFNTAKRKAEGLPFTPFAQFCHDLEGIALFENNIEIPKWEVWFGNCRNVGSILNGFTRYYVVDRYDTEALANQRKMY